MIFGDQRQVEWIRDGTAPGVHISCAIPPSFEDYATIMVSPYFSEREAQWDALLRILRQSRVRAPWWLGFLETGSHDGMPFEDPPYVKVYSNWNYALVQKEPREVHELRRLGFPDRGPGPDLLFPEDHSWLVSWLWDDEWQYFGSSTALVEAVLADPVLVATRVTVDQPDATPKGWKAR